VLQSSDSILCCRVSHSSLRCISAYSRESKHALILAKIRRVHICRAHIHVCWSRCLNHVRLQLPFRRSVPKEPSIACLSKTQATAFLQEGHLALDTRYCPGAGLSASVNVALKMTNIRTRKTVVPVFENQQITQPGALEGSTKNAPHRTRFSN
jgi:hypothetical protein